MATRTVTLDKRQTGGALQFLWGTGITIATFVAYICGLFRALLYDAAGSRGNFIATASLLDPFRRQVGYNNQVLFSFLEHVVYSAGFQSVSALRVLPVTCAALTVGVLAGMTARWFGYLSSTVAVAVLALNPEFATQGRDVRGYSLVALMGLLSTLCLLRWLRGSAPRWIPYAYVATLVVAIGTNLFALGIVVVQVAVLLARREFTRPPRCCSLLCGRLRSPTYHSPHPHHAGVRPTRWEEAIPRPLSDSGSQDRTRRGTGHRVHGCRSLCSDSGAHRPPVGS